MELQNPPANQAPSSRVQPSGFEAEPAIAVAGIPDYVLLRRIGRGAYGEVWLARNFTGSFVAVKIVARNAFDHDRPFEREFEGIKRFEPISRSDPSQVAILHVGRGEGFFYYVMELADGLDDPKAGIQNPREGRIADAGADDTTSGTRFSELSYVPHTLREDLKRHCRLPVANCIAIGLALARALAHLHKRGLVHRDVKPSNVVFVSGVPKLADIGLVTSVDATRSLVGTEGYVAPEGPGAPQGDLFSLGKLFYEMVTGCDRKEFPALPSDVAGMPERVALIEFNAIVMRACQFDPCRRYECADEIVRDLELLQSGRSVMRKHSFSRRWQIGKRGAMVAVLLALIAIAAMLVIPELKPQRRGSSNPQAEELYQRAEYLLQGATLERTRAAYSNLVEAIELEPNFLAAHYLMFEAYFGAWGAKLPPHYEEASNIREVAGKLRALWPESTEYHTVCSLIKYLDWDFDAAIEEIQLAIKLNPRFLRAHGLYAWYLAHVCGDAAASRKEYEAAAQIDGSDVIVQNHLADPYYLERNFKAAINQLRKAAALESRQAIVHYLLSRAYEADGQFEAAIEEDKQSELAGAEDPAKIVTRFAGLRNLLLTGGGQAWRQALLEEANEAKVPNPYRLARLHARLGHTNEVFPLLERAYQQHADEMTLLIFDDCWDPLRANPRFQAIVQKMRFRPKP